MLCGAVREHGVILPSQCLQTLHTTSLQPQCNLEVVPASSSNIPPLVITVPVRVAVGRVLRGQREHSEECAAAFPSLRHCSTRTMLLRCRCGIRTARVQPWRAFLPRTTARAATVGLAELRQAQQGDLASLPEVHTGQLEA